eukprot:TRINITY_DN1336_c1_g1_i1.p2 TRINITY_DN1336_c1_g1~~TRINITY_DN1336_c1_g1_i1.p2  ORF type:complete len:324 (+),score=52.53 TRINITY_DN1336_c1_g1_i1:83-1054(+)
MSRRPGSGNGSPAPPLTLPPSSSSSSSSSSTTTTSTASTPLSFPPALPASSSAPPTPSPRSPRSPRPPAGASTPPVAAVPVAVPVALAKVSCTRCKHVATQLSHPRECASCLYCEACAPLFNLSDSCIHGFSCELIPVTHLIRCGNGGCNAAIPQSQFASHEHSCVYRRVPCPHQCGASVVLKDLTAHQSICLLALVRCSGCNEEFKREMFPQHHSKCADVLVACPRECGVQCPRSHLLDHLSTCSKPDPFLDVDVSRCLEIFNLKSIGDNVVEEWLQVVGFNHLQVRPSLLSLLLTIGFVAVASFALLYFPSAQILTNSFVF